MSTDWMRADHERQIKAAAVRKAASDADVTVNTSIDMRRLKLKELAGETIISSVETAGKQILCTQSGFFYAVTVDSQDYDIGPYLRSCSLSPKEAEQNGITSATEYEEWKRAKDALDAQTESSRLQSSIETLVFRHGADSVRRVEQTWKSILTSGLSFRLGSMVTT